MKLEKKEIKFLMDLVDGFNARTIVENKFTIDLQDKLYKELTKR